MPNKTFKRWTEDDIAKLKNLARKQRREDIAAELGRSLYPPPLQKRTNSGCR
jgi:hypothetical protein